jgi:hypothetical protein
MVTSGAVESLSNTNGREGLTVTEPETPVEVLDAQVATVCDFVDRNGTKRRNVVELHGCKGTATPRRSSKMVMSIALVQECT